MNNTTESRFNVGDIVNSPDGLIRLTEKFYVPSDNTGWFAGWNYQYTSPDGTSYDAMMEQNYIWENDIITHS